MRAVSSKWTSKSWKTEKEEGGVRRHAGGRGQVTWLVISNRFWIRHLKLLRHLAIGVSFLRGLVELNLFFCDSIRVLLCLTHAWSTPFIKDRTTSYLAKLTAECWINALISKYQAFNSFIDSLNCFRVFLKRNSACLHFMHFWPPSYTEFSEIMSYYELILLLAWFDNYLGYLIKE